MSVRLLRWRGVEGRACRSSAVLFSQLRNAAFQSDFRPLPPSAFLAQSRIRSSWSQASWLVKPRPSASFQVLPSGSQSLGNSVFAAPRVGLGVDGGIIGGIGGAGGKGGTRGETNSADSAEFCGIPDLQAALRARSAARRRSACSSIWRTFAKAAATRPTNSGSVPALTKSAITCATSFMSAAPGLPSR